VPLKIKILIFYDKITRHFVPRNDILVVIPSILFCHSGQSEES